MTIDWTKKKTEVVAGPFYPEVKVIEKQETKETNWLWPAIAILVGVIALALHFKDSEVISNITPKVFVSNPVVIASNNENQGRAAVYSEAAEKIGQGEIDSMFKYMSYIKEATEKVKDDSFAPLIKKIQQYNGANWDSDKMIELSIEYAKGFKEAGQ